MGSASVLLLPKRLINLSYGSDLSPVLSNFEQALNVLSMSFGSRSMRTGSYRLGAVQYQYRNRMLRILDLPDPILSPSFSALWNSLF